MDVTIICLVALCASLLTFYSGFGLGTLLLPAFALFFSPVQAVAMTAVVHFANNIFKSGLVFKKTDWNIVLKFGLFSVPAAFLGAWLLKYTAETTAITNWTIGQKVFSITWQGLLIGLLMIFFAIYEVFPFLEKKIISKDKAWMGGLLSGFLGGFSGHQGAIRSAFLVRLLKEKEVYIATGTMIACLVDITRLGIYSGTFKDIDFSLHWKFIIFPVLAAFAGAFLGNKLIKKITLKFVKGLVCGLLIIFGLLTISGLLVKH